MNEIFRTELFEADCPYINMVDSVSVEPIFDTTLGYARETFLLAIKVKELKHVSPLTIPIKMRDNNGWEILFDGKIELSITIDHENKIVSNFLPSMSQDYYYDAMNQDSSQYWCLRYVTCQKSNSQIDYPVFIDVDASDYIRYHYLYLCDIVKDMIANFHTKALFHALMCSTINPLEEEIEQAQKREMALIEHLEMRRKIIGQ